MGDSNEGALQGLRVLELADAKGEYCGKLFADLGAEVIKIEPPEGSATRFRPPLWKGAPSDEIGLPFLYLNANKCSVTLDLTRPDDRTRFAQLAATADVIIETLQPGELEALGLGYDVLSQTNPSLVLTSITGFGQTGPHRRYRCSDLVVSALGGVLVGVGEPQDPPVALAGEQAYAMASVNAAASSLIAVHAARETGLGQQVDISVQETMLAVTSIAGVGRWLEDGFIPKRFGTALIASVPSGAYSCQDGKAYLMINRPAHWTALADWIHEVTGNQDVLNPMFEGPSSIRQPYRELLDLYISELTQHFCVADFYREGQARHLAVTPLYTARDLIEDAHLKTRGFFAELTHAERETLRYPGMPYHFEKTPWRLRSPAPGLGEHNASAFRALPLTNTASCADHSAPSERRSASSPCRQALAGLRVVEFTAGMAGPWIGRFLAYCGADVIKVESKAYPDVTRLYIPPRNPERGIQSQLSPWFTDWNAGKRFVAIDLAKTGGVDLAKKLIANSDVLIENYSNGVMAKLGLDYHRDLRPIAPKLIYFATTGYGNSGPNRDYVTWGPNIEALCGLASLSGFPQRDCTMTQFAYPDPLSALHGLFAILSALVCRERTGEGQAIHLSQLEASVAALGQVLMEPLLHGRSPVKLGNRSLVAAPQGVYPCAGDDRWCALTVENERQWSSFCDLLAHPEWKLDPRFPTHEARLENADALDIAICAWTSTRDPYVVMHTLQGVGIPAGVVQDTEDQFTRDPHLAARGFFERIPHEIKGEVIATGIPVGLTRTPGRTPHTGRAIGQDNFEVFRALGLSRERIIQLTKLGTIETQGA